MQALSGAQPCHPERIHVILSAAKDLLHATAEILRCAQNDKKESHVTHEQLWAPWRLAYVAGDAQEVRPRPALVLPGADGGCFICCGVADGADRENLVVARGTETVVILNRYPYNNGHLLVAPRRHKGRLDELTPAEHLECQQTLARLVTVLEQRLRAEGFNLGLNLGRVAGAGLPGHLHWHIVPRWHGDTNFMPVLAGVRVIPQSLDALWELLRG
jgi:ATP adenylyltransferase